MPINPERLERLGEMGLTEYQARAYLALLDLGSAPAKSVAAVSRVPKSKIYSTLEALHEKGLASVAPEHPRRYAPLPITGYLRALKAATRRRLTLLETRGDELSRDFAAAPAVPLEARGSASVSRGRRNVSAAIRDTIERAQHDFDFAGTAASAWRLRHERSELASARLRGVRARVRAARGPGCDEALRDLARVAAVEPLPADALPPGFSCVAGDRSRLVLVHARPDDDHLYQGEDLAVAIEDPVLVEGILRLIEGPAREPGRATGPEDSRPPRTGREAA